MGTFDDDNRSVSKGELESKFGISYIFFIENLVTFVYSDGRVIMQPKNCLEGQDKVAAETVTLEYKRKLLDDAMNTMKMWSDSAQQLVEKWATFSFAN